MMDPRDCGVRDLPRLRGLNKVYFPKDYEEQTRKNSYWQTEVVEKIQDRRVIGIDEKPITSNRSR